MDLSSLQGVLEGLDREKARLQDRLSEIERDRSNLLNQISEVQRLAAKYNLGSASTFLPPQMNAFNGTLRSLCHCYLTDARSPIHGLRHATKQTYASLLKRIEDTFGDVVIAELTEDHINRMHDQWGANGTTLPMAHAMITMVRSLAVFGVEALKDERCQRLSYVLHRMKFKVPEARYVEISSEQVMAVIQKAHEVGFHSIALAQALQYWTPLRQKDIIGEWIPVTEPEPSTFINKDLKWVRGLRWEQLDADFVLHHTTSKEGTELHIPLQKRSVIMAELVKIGRAASGPMIVSETSQLPWRSAEFRRQWRIIARECGIPNEVKNRDSRLGEPIPAEA